MYINSIKQSQFLTANKSIISIHNKSWISTQVSCLSLLWSSSESRMDYMSDEFVWCVIHPHTKRILQLSGFTPSAKTTCELIISDVNTECTAGGMFFTMDYLRLRTVIYLLIKLLDLPVERMIDLILYLLIQTVQELFHWILTFV